MGHHGGLARLTGQHIIEISLRTLAGRLVTPPQPATGPGINNVAGAERNQACVTSATAGSSTYGSLADVQPPQFPAEVVVSDRQRSPGEQSARVLSGGQPAFGHRNMIAQLAAFAGTSALVIVTPGPDTAVTISSTLGRGRAAGVCTALGVVCGQAAWTMAASTGLTALLLTSEPVFTVVRLAGSAYLVFLGLQALQAARLNACAPQAPLSSEQPQRSSRLACFRRGLLSDLGNPKMAMFFTSLLPQFGSHFTGLVGHGLVFCAMTFAWLACYALAIARISGLMRSSRIRRALSAITGAALVGFGVRLAAEHA